mgnify:FL=1
MATLWNRIVHVSLETSSLCCIYIKQTDMSVHVHVYTKNEKVKEKT